MEDHFFKALPSSISPTGGILCKPGQRSLTKRCDTVCPLEQGNAKIDGKGIKI